MDFASKIPMLTTIFLSLFLQSSGQSTMAPSPAAPSSPSNLVEDICGQTSNATFCLNTLGSDSRTSTASDVQAIAKIALELAINNSRNIRDYFSQGLKSEKTNPAIKPALEKCVMWYDAIVGTFRSAYFEIEEDPITANYDTLLVGTDYVGNCEKALTVAKVHIESLTARIQDTRYFSSIGGVVTNILCDSQSTQV